MTGPGKFPNWDNPVDVVAYIRQLDELEELRAYKARMDSNLEQVLGEQCNVLQHHCGCVPVLRAYITQLKAELKSANIAPAPGGEVEGE